MYYVRSLNPRCCDRDIKNKEKREKKVMLENPKLSSCIRESNRGIEIKEQKKDFYDSCEILLQDNIQKLVNNILYVKRFTFNLVKNKKQIKLTNLENLSKR